MKSYSLRELFELRAIQSLQPRVGYGRLFYHLDKPGFADESGAVWPVGISDHQAISPQLTGCIFRFASHVSSSAVDSRHGSGTSYLLCFESLSQVAGVPAAAWMIPEIPNPALPSLSSFSQASGTGTLFISTQTSMRFARIARRAFAIQKVREFFHNSDYLELDPPVLVASGGVERYLNTFETQYVDHRGYSWKLQLPTSPEFALKKIITEGCRRIFSVTHAFRNCGELSRHHDPEFLMLEWYRCSEDFESLMVETQKIVERLADVLGSSLELPREAWRRYSVESLFLNRLGMNLNELSDVHDFRALAAEKCSSIVPTDTWDDVFCKLFMEFVEPFLAEQIACFVTGYPAQMGALAAPSPKNDNFVDRFELYICGVEICNGYRELVDYREYLRRVTVIQSDRSDVIRDSQFENCFEFGMYPCVGNALGLDRLIALLLGTEKIQSVLPWPFASRFLPGTVALE